jgi:hypothetical protein
MMDLRDEYEFRPYNMQNDILSKNFHNEIIWNCWDVISVNEYPIHITEI